MDFMRIDFYDDLALSLLCVPAITSIHRVEGPVDGARCLLPEHINCQPFSTNVAHRQPSSRHSWINRRLMGTNCRPMDVWYRESVARTLEAWVDTFAPGFRQIDVWRWETCLAVGVTRSCIRPAVHPVPEAFPPPKCRNPAFRAGFSREPDDYLLSHGNPHYHRRRVVSRSCSGWEGVGPTRYGHQAKRVVVLASQHNQSGKKQ